MAHLNRESAGFDDSLWNEIDNRAVQAARDLLTVRRYLDVDGPFGVGLTSVELGGDRFAGEAEEGEAEVVASRAVSVPMLRQRFSLSIRRIEAHRQLGQPLNLNPVQDAGEAVARREERLLYYGQKDYGLDGLLTVEGRHQQPISDWSQVGQALDDVLNAVNRLDGVGFRGPYALVLSPALYNGLFRRYECTDMLQVEHLNRLCQVGVFKAAVEGGAVIDPRAGRIVVGQDLRAGYVSHDGIHHQLFLSESLVLLIDEPQAICGFQVQAG